MTQLIIDIPSELHKMIKIEASKRDKTMKELVTESILAYFPKKKNTTTIIKDIIKSNKKALDILADK